MTTASQQTPSGLVRLLEEEQRYLTQFLEITRAQAPIIEGEDIDALNKNLELRAQIIEKLDGLRPELDRLFTEHATRPGGADGPAIEDLREQISRILEEITEIDHKNQSAMRERMDYFQVQIRRASETRKGVGAYLMSAEVFNPEFVDERQ